MSLLELLRSEAVERGLLESDRELDAAQVYALVRDMPYMRASSRVPETTIREWRGTCSGKHYLLKALFEELGLTSRLIACTTESHPDPETLPPKLRSIVERAGGRIVDIHNYLVLELPGGDMVVDATWPLALKALGFPVNEKFVFGQDQKIAGDPLQEWVVPEEQDYQAFKDRLLEQNFTPRELADRDEFLETFSQTLAGG